MRTARESLFAALGLTLTPVFLAAWVVGPVSAQIPRTMSYQGRLLDAGSSISMVPAGQALTISATGGGGVSLPFASTTASASPLLDVTNSGTGRAGSLKISNAVNTEPALYARSTGLAAAAVVDGLAYVGSLARSGELHLFRNGVASAMIQGITTAQPPCAGDRVG